MAHEYKKVGGVLMIELVVVAFFAIGIIASWVVMLRSRHPRDWREGGESGKGGDTVAHLYGTGIGIAGSADGTSGGSGAGAPSSSSHVSDIGCSGHGGHFHGHTGFGCGGHGGHFHGHNGW